MALILSTGIFLLAIVGFNVILSYFPKQNSILLPHYSSKSVGVIDGVVGGLAGGLLIGLLAGLVAGLTAWLIGRLKHVLWRDIFRNPENKNGLFSHQSVWKIIKTISAIGSFSGGLSGMRYGLGAIPVTLTRLSAALNVGIVFIILTLFSIIFLGVFYTPIMGLMGGFKGSEIQFKNIPNQGIWKSAKNALIGGVATSFFTLTLVLALVFIISLVTGDSYTSVLASSSIGTWWISLLKCFLFGAIVFGGLASFRHFILRLRLYRQNYAPWNYAKFLDYATERLFMQKVGGGYIFVHRMLLEHFAQIKSEIK